MMRKRGEVFAGGSPNFDERTGKNRKGGSKYGSVRIPPMGVSDQAPANPDQVIRDILDGFIRRGKPVGGRPAPSWSDSMPAPSGSIGGGRQQDIRDSMPGIPFDNGGMIPVARPQPPMRNQMGQLPAGGMEAMAAAFDRARAMNQARQGVAAISNPQPQGNPQAALIDALRKMGL